MGEIIEKMFFLNFSNHTMKCHDSFSLLYFRIFAQNYQFTKKMNVGIWAWRDFKKKSIPPPLGFFRVNARLCSDFNAIYHQNKSFAT